MKRTFSLNCLSTALAALLLIFMATSEGCSKKIAVDTVKLEYSFQSADATTQSSVTEAVEAIDKADYSTALTKLKAVAANPKLTTEQKTAVNGVISQLEKP